VGRNAAAAGSEGGRVAGKTITDICKFTVKEARYFPGTAAQPSAKQSCGQNFGRNSFAAAILDEVGLDYLSLDRLTSTLSGGESQRIQLATSLGSHLVGALYVLDEPSIGPASATQNG
jgi:excinuclease ABC subunit A